MCRRSYERCIIYIFTLSFYFEIHAMKKKIIGVETYSLQLVSYTVVCILLLKMEVDRG